MIEMNKFQVIPPIKSGPRIDTIEDKPGSNMHLSPAYDNTLEQTSALEAPKDVKLELSSQRKPVFEIRGKTNIDAGSDSGKETPVKNLVLGNLARNNC